VEERLVSGPLFTVFTPTFNRAHTLHRVRDSLARQTLADFEWLIVDDGSSDGTESLVASWIEQGGLNIRYIRQSNRGKHRAFNAGVASARGELFLPLDSDDACVADALERFASSWAAIPEAQRAQFSGITCLCVTEGGDLVGGPLPAEVIDGRWYEVIERLGRAGEMWGFHRTSVLREFPFPDFEGERFIPEGVVWNRIARGHLMRFINVGLRTYFDSTDSLSRSMARIRHQSRRGTMCFYKEHLELGLPIGARLRCAANLWRFGLFGSGRRTLRTMLATAPLTLAFTALPGLALALRDRARGDLR
jgi:glycosyltransferase involved in cell wall biosynthesis